MVVDKNWPAWRYGPSGEAQIFQREADVPKGWVDSPSKLPPAPEKLGGDTRDEVEALRAENDRLQGELADLRKEAQDACAEIAKLQHALASSQPRAGTAETQPTVRRGPRKLSAAPGTPFTPQDDTVTLDEGRTERLKVLREAGITIADDATDGDIEEAMDWLEEQSKPSKKG